MNRLEELYGLVEKANRVQSALYGLDSKQTFKKIKEIVDGADVVFGVFQEEGAPNGVGLVLIKGANRLREIVATGITEKASVAAIPCIDRAQAEACAHVWGDKVN